MQAELIFTGTELLLGEILNTHAQYLGRRLLALGIEVILHTTVGDDWERLAQVLRQSLQRATGLIIITGGLGPTSDDLTKETVAGVLGLPMVVDEATLRSLEEYAAGRGVAMSEGMAKQAYFPAGARILPNPVGTAPGALLEHQGKVLVLLPGPPGELKAMFEEAVVPYLSSLVGRGPVICSRVLKVTGLGETGVQQLIGDLVEEQAGISYLARPGEVHVRVSARAPSEAQARQVVADLLGRIQERLGDYVFGFDEEVLEEVVGRLLAERGLTLALAESCTGGLIGARLTSVPGSSRYFLGSLVAYHNRVKERVLGVPGEVLQSCGAVSREVAAAMARGARLLAGADIGVGVTGIAGPAGGTPSKPVGLTYIALDVPEGSLVREYRFPGRREAVRQGATNAALNMVRLYLLRGFSG